MSTSFGNKLLLARKNGAAFFDNVADLDGLSEQEIEAARMQANAVGNDGQYMISLVNTTQQPVLQSLTNRNSREKIYQNSWNRSTNNDEGDTRETLEQMVRLRLQKAQLMGKKSFAQWKLQDQIAKDPEVAMKLLAQVAAPAVESLQNKKGNTASTHSKDFEIRENGERFRRYILSVGNSVDLNQAF